MAGVSGWSWPFPFVVPPCTPSATSATATRCQNAGTVRPDEAASSGLLSDANLEGDVTPPVTLGGYRLGGCQVAENPCHTGLNTAFTMIQNSRRKARQPQQYAIYRRLAHDPEKRIAVFRKDHAQTTS